MKIGRTYRFEAAHHLPLVPDGHKCKNIHGHNYRLDVILDGDVDKVGFVVDFAVMDAVINPLVRKLDHRLLNEVILNPTAENIADWFLKNINDDDICTTIKKCLSNIRVYENDDCWAEVTV